MFYKVFILTYVIISILIALLSFLSRRK